MSLLASILIQGEGDPGPPPEANVEMLRVPNGRLDAALRQAQGEWITVLDPGDRLLAAWSESLRGLPDTDILYGDSLEIDPATGRGDRFFFRPAWSPNLNSRYPLLGRGTAIRRDLALRIGGFHDDLGRAAAYDLCLRAVEETAELAHVSRPLIAEVRRGGDPEPFQRASAAASSRRTRPAAPRGLTTIIVPTRDRVDLLRSAIESLERFTTLPHELVVVDNGSTDAETLRYLATFPGRVLRHPGTFNFSAINNHAVAESRGDFLVFLNNDTEIHDASWLPAMLDAADAPGVGAVGAKLRFPNGRLQHVGVVTHPGAIADHLLSGEVEETIEHPYFPRFACEVNAVTAACLAIRRDVFERVGGFDPVLAVAYNDIDLCLRLRQHGYRNLFTPAAELTHRECASRDPQPPLADEVIFRSRWAGSGLDEDPFLIPVCRTIGYAKAIPGGVRSRPELRGPLAGPDAALAGDGFGRHVLPHRT